MKSSVEQNRDLAPGPVYHLAAAVFNHAMTKEVTVSGLENIPADRGAVLAYTHHDEGWDIMGVSLATYNARRQRQRFLGIDGLFNRIPGTPIMAPWLMSRLMYSLHALPIDIGAIQPEQLLAAADAARQGDLVSIAPEGYLVESDRVIRLKRGAGLIAMAAGVEIIPVATAVPQPDSKFARRSLHVHAGEPLVAPDTGYDVYELLSSAPFDEWPRSVHLARRRLEQQLRGHMQGTLEESRSRYEAIHGPL
ncbi:MAG TPA: lysophospholipid acyltransferase family protein [Candidatus Saccharimonadales bacterium]|nr:lysophospholipid acyltransferase family protein [Candidatus Saccharimonadales bacterium]